MSAAAAIFSGSRGGTTSPVSPTASLTPPTSVETVVRPHDMASMIEKGKPSDIDDSITTCPAAYARHTSLIRPSKLSPSVTPSSAASFSSLVLYASPPVGTGPNNRSLVSGSSARTMAYAWISVSRSLMGSIRPHQVSVGTSGSGPACGKACGSTPL